MDEERTTTVEIDGQTWRHGDIGMCADGMIVQLRTRWNKDRWSWIAFGCDDQWWLEGDPGGDDPVRPIRKIYPCEPVKVFVVVSDCGLNGPAVHGVYTSEPDRAKVDEFTGVVPNGPRKSGSQYVAGTTGYQFTDIVELVLDADLK